MFQRLFVMSFYNAERRRLPVWRSFPALRMTFQGVLQRLQYLLTALILEMETAGLPVEDIHAP
jgi:hypothetical protein